MRFAHAAILPGDVVVLQTLVFFVACSVLLVAQSVLVVRAVIAARATNSDTAPAVDALWTALPGLMLLALLAYSLLHAPAG